MGFEKNGYGAIHVVSRSEWRDWLAANHGSVEGVWLISHKKATGKPVLDHAEAVEEALCFGWIDSLRNTIDDERFIQLFTPRRRRSPWSKINKGRVGRLIAAGMMTEAGLASIEQATRDGSWEVCDAVESMTIPPDLEAALAGSPAARAAFEQLSPSLTKQIPWRIASAKRPETRAKRIAEIVAAAAEGRNPLDPKPANMRTDANDAP
jgi:uncharacterized protein YdeI (YjbR/CyaY-like superfamily)